jgi:chromosome segregation ATPase
MREVFELRETNARMNEEYKNAKSENQKIQFKLTSVERAHDATKKAAQQEIESHEKEAHLAEASREGIKRDLESAKNEIARLQAEIERLYSQVHEANQALTDQQRSDMEKITQLRAQNKLLSEKNDKLRDMVIPVSEEQVLDAEVMAKFTAIRTSIFALVRRTWKMELRDGVLQEDLSKEQLLIFGPGGEDIYDRTRGIVFHFVHQHILGSQNYVLQDGLEEFEWALQVAERELFDKSPIGKYTASAQNRRVSMYIVAE